MQFLDGFPFQLLSPTLPDLCSHKRIQMVLVSNLMFVRGFRTRNDPLLIQKKSWKNYFQHFFAIAVVFPMCSFQCKTEWAKNYQVTFNPLLNVNFILYDRKKKSFVVTHLRGWKKTSSTYTYITEKIHKHTHKHTQSEMIELANVTLKSTRLN